MMIIEMCTCDFNMIIMNKIESYTIFTSWSPLVDIVVPVNVVYYCCFVDYYKDIEKIRRKWAMCVAAGTPLK